MDLPFDFVSYTRNLLGDEAFARMEEALHLDAVTSIRLNVDKLSENYGRDKDWNPVPWASSGYYLDNRFTFTFDPLFHAGCYYVQEASSMFVEQVLKHYVKEPVIMLDLCAAPGGKSTHARSLLPEGSLLVSNEVMRNRVQVLAENMIKWGHPDVVVTNNDPADFAALKHYFDVILTDVPCSGEGMFRKDETAVSEWSTENVTLCWQRQRRILSDIWNSLKPGGILIYSTCTYNLFEDEDNVEWIIDELGAEPLNVPVFPEWNITSDLSGRGLPVYRFLPHKTKGEGFFLAALRKSADEAYSPVKFRGKKKDKKCGRPCPVPSKCKEWVQNPESYEWTVSDGKVFACPQAFRDDVRLLQQALKIVSAGIEVGEIKGKDCIPSHQLAMSKALATSVFPSIEVSYEQAISYLRKESIQLSETLPSGYILLTYKTVSIGFVKNLGARSNNLYPLAWRIKSSYIPDVITCL